MTMGYGDDNGVWGWQWGMVMAMSYGDDNGYGNDNGLW